MALEDAKKFLDKVFTDKELRGKMKATSTNEERKKISDDLGLAFSQEELEQAYQARTELSDAELDAVAGGGSATWVGTISGAVGAGAGIAAAFAACGW